MSKFQPKTTLPFVKINVARGRPYYNFRRGEVLVKMEPPAFIEYTEDPDFVSQWAALQAQYLRGGATEAIGRGTFDDLVTKYKASSDFLRLAAKTQHDYSCNLDVVREHWGALPVRGLRRQHIYDLRDKFATRAVIVRDPMRRVIKDAAGDPLIETRPSPRRANMLAAVLSLLLSFGVDRGFRDDNPAFRIKKLKGGRAFQPWSADEFDLFIASGLDPDIRAAAFLGRYTGQRRGDLLSMTWSADRGATIELEQRKTGARLSIPVVPALRSELDQRPRFREISGQEIATVTILATKTGVKWDGANFDKRFRKALNAAGLYHLTFHGLRHLAATELADAGCSDREIMAITGHKSAVMVSHYTKTASQPRRAQAAIHKLEAHRGKASTKD